MSGTLYIVGTPIGNLEDITLRSIRILNEVDFIAAEDTRVTIKLLNHLNIKKPMVSYFEHNKKEKGSIIYERIKNGENCALVSDAGMPAISDPGEDLIRQCHFCGINVRVIPGPTACISAICLSGISSGRFTFEGFLSMNKKNRVSHLNNLKEEPRTMILYEAPHKLLSTLKDLYEILGDRDIAIVKEITKVHEEIKFLKVSEAISIYSKNTKGEFVLIIKGIKKEEKKYTIEQAIEIAKSLIKSGHSICESAKQTSKTTNIKKSEIYEKLVKLK